LRGFDHLGDCCWCVAITVAFGTSLAATFSVFEIEVWWDLASLITIVVLGHWLEMRAIPTLAALSMHSPRCSRTLPNA